MDFSPLSPSCHLFYVPQIPSFSAVVLDLLSTFLQRLHENINIFVGLDPNQFLRQGYLKLHIWEQNKQELCLIPRSSSTEDTVQWHIRHSQSKATRFTLILMLVIWDISGFSSPSKLITNLPSEINELSHRNRIWRKIWFLTVIWTSTNKLTILSGLVSSSYVYWSKLKCF